MLKGTLIDDLMAVVERAEERAHEQSLIHDERLTYFYSIAEHELAHFELAGVA